MSRNRSGALKVRDAAPLFAALGDETRLGLVVRLSAEGPLSIARLSEGSDVTRQAITKHLELLVEAGFVEDTKQGRERIFELAPKRLEKARQCLDHISAQWDTALDRLKDFVEKER